MKVYGLIGKKLGHSFSPAYFNKKFEDAQIDAVYKLFELESIESLPDFIEHAEGLVGFNVTIPYKKDILPYLDRIDTTAKQVGSVNTVKVEKKENKYRLTGYNTDVIGFEESLLELISGKQVDRAIVLGTGGSAKAVIYVLEKLNIEYVLVSRTSGQEGIYSYKELTGDMISTHPLIINTTPVGMYPETAHKPDIPYHLLSTHHVLYDLIYNPVETEFLKEGQKRGASTMSGGRMLQIQADEAWKIWNA